MKTHPRLKYRNQTFQPRTLKTLRHPMPNRIFTKYKNNPIMSPAMMPEDVLYTIGLATAKLDDIVNECFKEVKDV